MRGAGLALGVTLDALLGDPRRGHPVAAFGRAASALEKRLYGRSKVRGAAFTVGCVAAAAGAGLAAERVTRRWSLVHTATTALATWAVLGGTSLGREGRQMARLLEGADLEAARDRLPHLCGRDPAGLDGKALARATVESVAENTSDAAVAPLLWGAVAGIPGLLAYRAINTLDAMVGYRNERYAEFGWASARLDDVVNWMPARLTGLLTVVCTPVVGGRPGEAYTALRRYGPHHPSPNAGRCEAAFAGALGVRLGGTNVYGGRVESRPALGEGRTPEVADIRRAVRLSTATTLLSALVAVVIGGRR
jgi:adenosylcobinamide-phosphate synthase